MYSGNIHKIHSHKDLQQTGDSFMRPGNLKEAFTLIEILVAGVKYGDFIFLLPVGQVERPQLLLHGGVLTLCLGQPNGNRFFAVFYIDFRSFIALHSVL